MARWHDFTGSRGLERKHKCSQILHPIIVAVSSTMSAPIHPSFLVPIVSDQPRNARGDRCRYEDRPYPPIGTAVASSITTKR